LREDGELERGPTDSRGEVVYRESHIFNPVFLIFIVALIVLYLVVTVGGITRHKTSYAVIFGLLSLIFMALLANFWRLIFVVYSGEVVFGFGLARHRLPRSAITSCEPYELKFSNYLGYGIRGGLDHTIAYNTRNGPGVKLEVEGARRPYVISLDNPPYVCELLSGKPRRRADR
jgi:hypothetical protein